MFGLIDTRHIPLAAAALSLLTAVWLIYTDGIINRDGILYLQAAEFIARGNWQEALATYPWPFYPWLIAVVGLLTGLELEAAAYVLNALIQALIVYAFVRLVGEVGGDRATLIAATLLILISPEFNESRAQVIRDFGYWAFFLLSLLFFIRYAKRSTWLNTVGWGAFMAVAFLFRIEGALFLFALPWALLLLKEYPWPVRLQRFAYAYLVGLLIVLLLFPIILFYYGERDVQTQLLIPVYQLIDFWAQLGSSIQAKAAILSEEVLNQYSSGYALPTVIGLLIFIFISTVVTALHPVYALFAGYAFLTGAFRLRGHPGRIIVSWAALLAVLIIVGFLVPRFFLLSRYVMPLTLLLMIPASFGLAALYQQRRTLATQAGYRKWIFPGMVAALLYVAIDGLYSTGASKTYLREAGLWLKRHTPVQSQVYSNSPILAYYAGKGFESIRSPWEWEQSVRHSDQENIYIAINLKRNEPDSEKVLGIFFGKTPIAEFANNKGDRAVIFQY